MRRSFAETLDAPGFVWGEGEMPSELGRFNLAAFVYPGLWSLMRGLYGWWLVFVARWVIGVSVSRTVFPIARQPRSWLALPVTLSEPGRWALLLGFIAANLALDFWFGMNADRLMWAASARSTYLRPNNDLASVEGYIGSQAGCARTTAILFVVGLGLLLIQTLFGRDWTTLSIAVTATNAIAIGGVVLWWWLGERGATR